MPLTTPSTLKLALVGCGAIARAAYAMAFDPYWFAGAQPWRFAKARTGGGVVIDGGSHWLRPLRMWLGEIDEVVAALDYPLEPMEGESLARALLRYRSGKLASFEAMMLPTVLGPDAWWRIIGTRGELVIESGFRGGLRLYNADHPDGRLVLEPQGYARSFGPELEDFACAVLDGTPLAAGPEQSLGELRAALAIYRSAESKRWEKVWE
jgi:predicted dehydrogenase